MVERSDVGGIRPPPCSRLKVCGRRRELDPLPLTVIASLPAPKRLVRVLPRAELSDRARQPFEIIAVKRGSDVQVTGRKPHAMQERGENAAVIEAAAPALVRSQNQRGLP